MTREEVWAALRECLYGECKNCPFVSQIGENGSRGACRLTLLSYIEDVLIGKEVEEWVES